MRTMAGVLKATGAVQLEGEDLASVPAFDRVRRGIGLVPEGRRLFAGMTVNANLLMGAYTLSERGTRWTGRLEKVLDLFPILRERRGSRSGHAQRRRAADVRDRTRPDVRAPRLLVDELSLGLAPIVVDRLLEALIEVRRDGTSLLVVDQDLEGDP